MRMFPLNSRSGANESAAHALNVSVIVPASLMAPASISSERIHRHASRNVSSGKRNAVAPKSWKKKSERYAPGIANQIQRARG